jgi:hypothetical protein
MEHGGSRQGAGRRKGMHNKASARRELFIAETGATPLDVIIHIMRFNCDMAENELRKEKPNKSQVKAAFAVALDAANKAAPFVHQKFAAADYNSKFDMSKLSDDEKRNLSRLLAKGLDLPEHPSAIEQVKDAAQH